MQTNSTATVTASADVYETYRFATWDRLREAFKAGALSEKQTRVLLARKGYDHKQTRLIIKGWRD